MKEKMEENESKKDISNRWLDNIANNLDKLQRHESLAREGCESILEFATTPIQHSLEAIQLKNVDMFFSEFEMTMANIKSVIDKEELQTLKDKLKSLVEIKNNGVCKKGKPVYRISKIIIDQRSRSKQIRLEPAFFYLVDQVGKLRGELIKNLGHILWLKNKEENVGGED